MPKRVRRLSPLVLVLTALALREGWGPADLCPSDLRGAEGNQEFFLLLRPSTPGATSSELARRIREAIGEEAEA